MQARYDQIGVGYDNRRKADPYLASRLHALLQPNDKGNYLDVGCGTGNYTHALRNKGVQLCGVEPSDEMIRVAREKMPEAMFYKGAAENIPLEGESMGGAVATLTIHHWSDLNQGMAEIHRVVKPGGRFVLFTSLPEQTGAYWLSHYWPKMMADSCAKLPSMDHIETALRQAGFNNWETEKYFVKPDLEDQFLYKGKFDPSYYFDPVFRSGISSFSDLANHDEVEAGLNKLRSDMDSGRINKVMKEYENDFGDYLFIVVQKS